MTAPASDKLLALVADLSASAARAHTEVTLVPALGAALARHLPIRWIELTRSDGGDAKVQALVWRPGAEGAARASRRMRGSLAALALEQGAEIFSVPRSMAAKARAPEIRRARDAGADTLAVLPLREGEAILGAIALGIAAKRGAAIPLSPALLDAIAGAVVTAIGQVRLLGRVAALSRRAHGEVSELRGELERATEAPDIVAQSPLMRAIVHEIVPLVARQDTTVLLRGETGTGKEIIARRIHELSPRRSKPFLRVNCGALPEGLVESALFGHERGAFTGASVRHAGVFERAHGGTLFLDEVAELPLAAQVKLLRAIQEGEIERVGGEETIRVSARVIAATHRPLEAMVQSGLFREDLYYRLDVFPIALPPLRDRPEDIDGLVAAILARLSARFGRRPPRVSEPALTRLRAHAWPGNVRELENVLERALVISTGDELRIPRALGPGVEVRAEIPLPAGGRVETYRAAVVRCIQAALAASGGRIYGKGGAAAALGLKPTTLQSKVKKLGIRVRRGSIKPGP